MEIEYEHDRKFVANPNLVTFYNQGQAYLRNAISQEGDRCDWFGLESDTVRQAVRRFDRAVDDRPEWPFRVARGCTDPRTYLAQRRLFLQIEAGEPLEPLAIEELVVELLWRAVGAAYRGRSPARTRPLLPSQRECVHHVEQILSERWSEGLKLRDIAQQAGVSPFHLCRIFRRATGMTLRKYRERLRVRWSLESVMQTQRRFVDIALESGFSSHSHFTCAFQNEFSQTPSVVRAGNRIR